MNKLMRILFKGMPRTVSLVLAVTILFWLWAGFKRVESMVMPVVNDFEIVEVVHKGNEVLVHGTMNKVRECVFIEVVAYRDGKLVAVDFRDNNDIIVTRVEGVQYWGWWALIPDVDYIEIYSRHHCSTGTVITKLFEGDI